MSGEQRDKAKVKSKKVKGTEARDEGGGMKDAIRFTYPT